LACNNIVRGVGFEQLVKLPFIMEQMQNFIRTGGKASRADDMRRQLMKQHLTIDVAGHDTINAVNCHAGVDQRPQIGQVGGGSSVVRKVDHGIFFNVARKPERRPDICEYMGLDARSFEAIDYAARQGIGLA
jgi:hypothetical protein